MVNINVTGNKVSDVDDSSSGISITTEGEGENIFINGHKFPGVPAEHALNKQAYIDGWCAGVLKGRETINEKE